MSKFKVGEIVIGQNFIRQLYRNSAECEIIGGLQTRTSTITGTTEVTIGMKYKVKWSDGTITCQPEMYLKKKPPEEASWEEIQKSTGWNPAREIA